MSPDTSRNPSTGRGSPEVSVIIPCLNEAACAPRYPKDLFAPLEAAGFNCEVIFSDGGSSDGTAEALRRAAAGRPWARILETGGRASFAESIELALPFCSGEYIVLLEADLSFSPLDIRRLLEEAKAGDYDCVCGSPFLGSFEGLPPFRRLLTSAANAALRLRFGRKITSFTQIFKLYRARALRALEFENSGFTLDAELLAKSLARGYRISEIPVIMKARTEGCSKLAVGEELVSSLRLILKGVAAGR